MRSRRLIRAAAALTLALTLGFGPSTETRAQDLLGPRPKADLAFNRLYDYPELVAAMRKLVQAHPDLLTMSSLGKSVEGRDLWCVTICNPKTGPESEKPAMYADGNVHGNEVQASEACLYLIYWLAENYAKVPKVRRIVDERVFYVVPTVNPDGRAHWFANANTTSSSRSGKKPRDDDRDGLADEDGYDDLDGDGQISMMRRKSPQGGFILSPGDRRQLIPAPAGQKGEYEMLGLEGIDNDGDGAINEDPPGGYDMNRNYPGGWQPNHVQFGAGPYPLCWPETRAVAEFVLAHPNIAGAQSFHNAGGMILRGPGHPTRQDQYPPEDDRIANALAEEGARMLPGYRNMVIHKDLYAVHGGFVTWTYENLGIFSFTNEIWNNDSLLAGGVKSPADDLFAADKLMQGSNYVEWKPIKHPKYGDIEIGGFVKQSQRMPPSFMLEESCHRNAAFVIHHADQMPKIVWDETTVKPIGDGVYEVTATLRNTRKLPSRARQAIRRNIGRTDSLSISGAGLRVLAGGVVNGRDGDPQDVELVERNPDRVPLVEGVPSEGTAKARWFIQGQGEATLRYSSRQAGVLSRTLKVQ